VNPDFPDCHTLLGTTDFKLPENYEEYPQDLLEMLAKGLSMLPELRPTPADFLKLRCFNEARICYGTVIRLSDRKATIHEDVVEYMTKKMIVHAKKLERQVLTGELNDETMTYKMLVEIKTRRMWEKFPINFQVKNKNFRISSLPEILHEDENSKANSSANSRHKMVSDSRRFSTPRGPVHVPPEDHVISDFLNQAFVSSSRGLVEESRNLVASPSLGGSERISVELARPSIDLARPDIDLARPVFDLACPSIELARPSIDLARPNVDLARPSIDLARPSIDLALPSIELARPNIDVARPNGDLARPSIDLARPSIDLVRPSIDLGRPSMDLDRPSTDLARPVASAGARPVAGARAKVDAPSAALPNNAVNVDLPVAEVYKRLGKVLPGYRRIVGGLEADVECGAHGANIDAADFQGSTPLIWASYTGRVSVVRALLAAGADTRLIDGAGNTAASCAGEDPDAPPGSRAAILALLAAAP
jgi:hypothetical protein